MEEISSIAITTRFRHHAGYAGYIQLLNYTKPAKVFGLDETMPLPSRIKQKYQWLYEFDVKKFLKKNKTDILHILYGEDYFRFSAGMLKIPVVATFHHPPELLRKDIEHGNLRGRIGWLTHLLTKNRYRKLGAAIVLTTAQKELLAQAMPASNIFVIPHGISIDNLQEKAARFYIEKKNNRILTVGQWMRDWEFYFRFVKHCLQTNKTWQFVLINRNLPGLFREKMSEYPNLLFLDAVPDDELVKQYCSADALFLPLKGATANNAVAESLALGCPVIMSDVLQGDFAGHDFLRFFSPERMEEAEREIEAMLSLRPGPREKVSGDARTFSKQYSWASIAERTMEVYKHALEHAEA